MYSRLILLFVFIACGTLASAQGTVEEISGKLNAYITGYPQEKVFIHTDREIYSPEQMIWFKGYVVNAATHVPMDLSRVLYVELLDERLKKIAERRLFIDGGFAAGNILIPEDAVGGNYVIRGYTQYMLNQGTEFLFRKELTVIDMETPESLIIEEIVTSGNTNESVLDSHTDLRFFPEGGHLVAEQLTVMGIKATAPDGFGKKVSGSIFNSKGEEVARFESNDIGLGKVALAPLQGESYFAKIDGSEFQYELPEAEKDGFILKSRNFNGTLTVQATHSGGISMEGYSLLLHTSGIPVAFLTGTSNMNTITTKLATEKFERGILTITLFDPSGKPLAERLNFIYQEKNDVLSVSTDKSDYEKRDKVGLTLNLAEGDSAQVSMAVVRPEYLDDVQELSGISHYLLLESDIKGYIEDIRRYFDPENADREEELDALLLTQGWRRFNWEEVNRGKPVLDYRPEFGVSVSGKLVNFYNEDKPVDGVVSLSFVEDFMSKQSTETDENGNFIFRDLLFVDSVTAIIQGEKMRQKRRNRESDKDDPVKIILTEREQVPVTLMDTLFRTSPSTVGFREYQESVDKISQIFEAYNFDAETIILDEIAIKGYRDDWRDSPFNRGQPYKNPTRRLVPDSMAIGNQFRVVDMLRRLPGIQIFGTMPNYQIMIRGMSSFATDASPLILVDNVQVDIEYLATMDGTTVDFIDVLTTAQATMYGALGYGGVIAVYTNNTTPGKGSGGNAQTDRLDWGVNAFELVGYQVPDNFFAPRYDVKREEHIRPDYRSVLHWEPTIMIREGEPTEFDFYTSDEVAEYLVITQGITYGGIPLFSVHTITVGKED